MPRRRRPIITTNEKGRPSFKRLDSPEIPVIVAPFVGAWIETLSILTVPLTIHGRSFRRSVD